ncbi:hypothetical protein ACNOYE_13795 [Nannocystaceae bacterium ST9]
MALENETELIIGGPGGIRIQGRSVQTGGSTLVPAPASNPNASNPNQELTHALAMVRSHPRAFALGFSFAGVAMLVGPAVLISAIGLPWLLYLAPVGLALTSFGVAIGLARSGPSKQSHVELEHRIIDLAIRSGGQLTVIATAHALKISLGEAEEALMALARANHVDIENDMQTGAVLYVFRDLRGQLGPGRPA